MAKNSRDKLNEVLSDFEKEKVQQFYDDEYMREAVKKVLLFGIYYNGTLKKGEPADPLNNFALGFVAGRDDLSDEQVGSRLRAAWEGINALELAFSQMANYKTIEESKVGQRNQAR